MTNWKPEFIVEEALAKQLIEKQFPVIAPISLYSLGEGFDNTVYSVNEEFVFRFPRRHVAVALLETEGTILPTLAPMLPLPISEPVFYGVPSEDYPWPFIGYKRVVGKTVMTLNTEQRTKMTEPLAEFLRTLHSIPADNLKVPEDELDRLNVEKRQPLLEEKTNQIAAFGLYDEKLLREYVSKLVPFKILEQNTLVHGDLHIRNILVDEEANLAGIIDWGDVHKGSRAVDLAAVYSLLLPKDRQRFFQLYGPVEFEERELARFRAIFTNAALLLYGFDKKDAALFRLAQESLTIALTF